VSRVATVLDKAGIVAKQPPFWVAAAGLVARYRRQQGRPTAVRALVGYGSAGMVANLVLKPLFGRGRPSGAGGRFGPLTSSFPSGHAACDTAFAVIAAREIPALTVPMVALTTASHWSLWRSRSHYVTDILAGDAVGLALALTIPKLWPTPTPATSAGRAGLGGDGSDGGGRRAAVASPVVGPDVVPAAGAADQSAVGVAGGRSAGDKGERTGGGG
jgi:membrane-associated phospholipid phosphatase